MKRLCVFAGSTLGRRPAYAAAARALAAEAVRRGVGLVYGGGSVGLMGVLADAALAAGGEVVGVIPRPLVTPELAHPGLTALHVVESMHERKALMARLADAFVALPGGLGTLEETLETATWSQLGIHRKPVGLLNVEGYWEALRSMVTHAVREGFIRAEYATLMVFADAPAPLLDALAAWEAPGLAGPWLTAEQA
ncbi:MAG TPA: TIGR00730 family Rossman fold protein [Calidithermus sp.]|nr:TIGR00730 family Rossman fold protein [Calidithermus sp.]